MKVVFVTSSRSDFGLIKPLVKHFAERSRATTVVTLGASAPSAADIRRDAPGAGVATLGASGRKRLTKTADTVSSFSLLAESFSRWLSGQRGIDWVFIPADRFEVFAAATAAFYNNLPIAHLFGGDRSTGGHLDDSARHAVAKLAHLHLDVCEDSRRRLERMGEEPWRCLNVGSPIVESWLQTRGEAPPLSRFMAPRRFNVLCTYHPIGTQADAAGRQFRAVAQAMLRVQRSRDAAFLLTYPNNEVGSRAIVAEIGKLRGRPGFSVHESLGWRNYLAAAHACDLVIGNSSSGLLEAPIVGTPTLDIGSRQNGRFAPKSVRRLPSYDPAKIAREIIRLLDRRAAPPRHPYGSGGTADKSWRILDALRRGKTRAEILHKKVTY